jgi:hypothetical protein
MLSISLPIAAQEQAAPQVQEQAPRASLVVIRGDGAQDCPDAATLADHVRAVAGANVIGVGPSAAPIETWVQVAISHDLGGYNAQLSASGRRHGTRSLEDLGPTCASLGDAVAVTIAMFLDPYEGAPSRAPAPALMPSERSPAARAQVVSAPAPAPAPASRFFVDGTTGFAFNLLEHTQPLLGLAFGWRASARWSLALGGTFVFPDRTGDGTPNVELRLSFASLQLCARALGDIDHASLAWCAAPQLGSLAGKGRGYQNDSSERLLWVALAFGPEAAFRLSRSLSCVLTGQGVIPLLEQGFDVQRNGVRSNAFQSPSVAGLASLSLRGHL